MIRLALTLVLILAVTGSVPAQPTPASVPDTLADSLAVAAAETLYVIPAGPVAGSFTPAARLTVDDTIAGWARIRVEGWVPVRAVLDRLQLEAAMPGTAKLKAASSPAERPQCAATTQKGTRCSRKAKPGSKFCWQHQPHE